MVMKNEDIINALGCLEMKGGMHQISEELRGAIISELQSHGAAKAVAKPAATRSAPKVKGKLPE